MVNALLKAGDKLAAKILPTAKASACSPGLINSYWTCLGNGVHGTWTKVDVFQDSSCHIITDYQYYGSC